MAMMKKMSMVKKMSMKKMSTKKMSMKKMSMKKASMKKMSMKKMSMKKSGMKRPLNAFFKLMLDAKKKGLTSFKYNGNTYKGKKHEKLGMIFKRA
jgi:hypothetical protein